MSDADGIDNLTATIGRYNDAWNAQDLDAIVAMHAPDMVFANHTAGESATGEEVRAHIASIFATWPDLGSRRGGSTCARGWSCRSGRRARRTRIRCAAATSRRRRPASTISWDGIDSIPFENGLVKRKDVYSDSVSILRQVGLLD